MTSLEDFVKLSVFMLSLSLIVEASWGAESPPALSLEDFVNKTIEVSRNVQSQKVTLDKSQDIVAEKQAAFLPTLSATVGTYKNGTSLSSTVASDYSQSKLNLSLNLFNGMQDKASLSAAKNAMSENTLLLADVKYRSVVAAMESFFTLLQLQSDAINQQKEIDYNLVSLKEAERKLSFGGARKTDVITLQSAIASNKILLSETLKSLNQEKIKAARLIAKEMTEFSINHVAGKCNLEMTTNALDLFSSKNRSDYRAKIADSESQLQLIETVKAKGRPTIDFTTGYVVADTLPTNQKNSYDMSLVMTIPFSMGPEKKSLIEQASKNYQISKIAADQTLNNLEQEREQLLAQLKDDKNLIQLLAESKILSIKNVEALEQDHRSGLAAYSSVLDAASSYQQVLRKYDRAVLQLDLDCYKAIVWSANDGEWLQRIKAGGA